MVDIDLVSNNSQTTINSSIDFSFTDDGDIKTIDSFETSLIFALFSNKDREIIIDDGAGSELYKLEQSKLLTATLNLYRFYSNQCIQYLYNDGYVNVIKTDVKQVSNIDLKLDIVLESSNKDKVYKHEYRL
jgi:phage gp46-like protein